MFKFLMNHLNQKLLLYYHILIHWLDQQQYHLRISLVAWFGEGGNAPRHTPRFWRKMDAAIALSTLLPARVGCASQVQHILRPKPLSQQRG